MKRQGEERAPAEKAGHLVATAEWKRERRKKLKAEDEEWASKSGPVEVRHREDHPPA